MSGFYDPFRSAVRARLDELGMSQRELAERSGVHAVALNRWLMGDRETLRPAALASIFSILGLRIHIHRDPAA